MHILPLELRNLSYRAGREILLDNITMTLTQGPITLIMGHNGAGKSLLLKLCHGLIEPSEGTVSWNKTQPVMARERQAMVFQKPVMLRRSVRANIEYPLKLRGFAKAVRRKRVDDMLEKTGLAAIADRAAPLLSGGEQQKLALARAWVLEPQVLFLDEPTASLDPRGTRDVEAIVRSIHQSGTKIIMTSHQVGQVKRLADEVLFLHDGKLVETGPAAQILSKPKSAQARAYLAGELPD